MSLSRELLEITQTKNPTQEERRGRGGGGREREREYFFQIGKLLGEVNATIITLVLRFQALLWEYLGQKPAVNIMYKCNTKIFAKA